MTKARDLANASTALSAVSATELGYLDGVTSAVQTQIDSKAASATAVSTAGGSTITVASGTTVPLTIQNNGTGNSLVVNDEATDTSNLVVDASGNVGIGTSSPATKSQISQTNTTSINGGTYLGLGKSENGVGGYRLIGFGYNPTTNYYPSALGYVETANNAGTAGDLIFLTRGQGNADTVAPTERMRIDSAGNVGVGKTATTKLDVNGTVNATAFTVGGAALSSGMTLIRRATMSAVANSGTSFDGVFTTAYKTYQIVFEGFQSSGASTDIRFNWRISGATQSGAAYNGNSVGWQHTGAFFSVPTAALTYFNVITTNNNSQHRAQGSLWAYQVGNTSETPAVGGVFHTSYSHGPVIAGCDYTAGNMDGFIITASTGTLTGTIAVYGLAI